jgi:voltage-gated potassium channel
MPRRGRDLSRVTLRRKGRMPTWLSVTWRVGFTVGLVVLAITVHWIERDGLRDNYDGSVSLLDVVYFTMISITTTGYGDITPVSNQARLFDALIVTPIRVFIVLIFLGTAYSLFIRRTWDRWRMALIQHNLRDHIIIAGYGETGSRAVEELLARGVDAAYIVVVDRNEAVLETPRAMGCAIIDGDATRDETLAAVRIDRARALIISAGIDDTSILVSLTARHLAPDIRISISIKNGDNELLARQAGATTVINPVNFAGLLLAGSSEGEHIADYLADLASSDGRVRLGQRAVRLDELDKPLSAIESGLGVRMYRQGKPFGFWEAEARSLRLGDIIVEILPTVGREAETS